MSDESRIASGGCSRRADQRRRTIGEKVTYNNLTQWPSNLHYCTFVYHYTYARILPSYCAYSRRDGQAELTWMAGYIPI